jgi:hypothetical protein
MGLLACSKAPPPLPQTHVTVKNDADAHEVQVFWTATGCKDMDVQHGAADVCHQEAIAAKKSSSYTFPKGTSARTVLLYRPKTYCALVGGSDLSDFQVPGDETLRTDGCVLQKDIAQSSMLNPEAR